MFRYPLSPIPGLGETGLQNGLTAGKQHTHEDLLPTCEKNNRTDSLRGCHTHLPSRYAERMAWRRKYGFVRQTQLARH